MDTKMNKIYTGSMMLLLIYLICLIVTYFNVINLRIGNYEIPLGGIVSLVSTLVFILFTVKERESENELE